MQRTIRIGMLSLAFAVLLMPLASAHTGAGVTVKQRELVCNLGQDVDTDDLPAYSSSARVVVKRDCSTAYAEYDASSNIHVICASIDFLGLLPPVFNGPIDQLETLPDSPPPYGPGAPAPHGCWLAAGIGL